jgi:hypothetical protein
MGLRTALGLKKPRSPRPQHPLKPSTIRPRGSSRAQELYRIDRGRFVELIEREVHPEPDRQFALAHDFFPSRRQLYDFQHFGFDDFVTDVERKIADTINGPFFITLRNKLIAYRLLAGHIRIPRIVDLYVRGKREVSLPEFVPDGTPLFVKPVTSNSGIGAETLPADVDYRAYIREKVKAYPDLLVMERVGQHGFMADLFPDSINTVRVLTVRDPDNRIPWVARAVVRVGTVASAPVDNFGSGGLSFALNVESGAIGPGTSKASLSPTAKVERHPDSGLQLTGRILPGCDAIIAKCIELHAALPFIDYVGWDICVGENGPILIEANNSSDVDLFQTHAPLLTDSRLRAFYKFHDVI